MGVLSYADYGEKGARRNSFVYQVRSALVFDHRKNQVWLTGDPDARDVTFRMELSELPSGGGGLRGGGSSSLSLQPDESDEHYLERVSQALEEIRDGRYYQINLLRYFRLQDPGRLNLLRRLCRHGGPAGAWFRQGERELLSFSPERFVSFRAEGDLVRLETRPVKGTAPRHRDEEEDRQARNDLLNSRKDRAELSMIIDLMRNDLHRVCEPGSVQVEEPGRVYSWSTLHHLAGRITGRARHDLTMGRLFRDLCPAGSITGAPKVEVMQAIAESEGRSRGCFMGNAFCWDPGAGIFDSSVLIRTMVRRSAEAWECAYARPRVSRGAAIGGARRACSSRFGRT